MAADERDWAGAEVRVRVACPACDGTGRWDDGVVGFPGGVPARVIGPCQHCDGTGRAEEWVGLGELARALGGDMARASKSRDSNHPPAV